MAACSTRAQRFSDDSSGLNDSKQKSQSSQHKSTRKVTQEADDGKTKCAGSKSKKGAKGGGKRLRTGSAIGSVKGLPNGSMEESMKGWVKGLMGDSVKRSVKEWVEELIVGLVRGSAGRKALKLLRASVTVRWRRAKWYAVTFARVGPISDVWG